uniref:Uncharacterized protein n=1 Tax=Cucumis melo TaxID=3656 RepID=A0A9I9CY99_CUCME
MAAARSRQQHGLGANHSVSGGKNNKDRTVCQRVRRVRRKAETLRRKQERPRGGFQWLRRREAA